MSLVKDKTPSHTVWKGKKLERHALYYGYYEKSFLLCDLK